MYTEKEWNLIYGPACRFEQARQRVVCRAHSDDEYGLTALLHELHHLHADHHVLAIGDAFGQRALKVNSSELSTVQPSRLVHLKNTPADLITVHNDVLLPLN